MIFNSIEFGIFFPLVFALYWLFFRNHIQARNIFLVAVSYIFYGWWDWRFLSLIVISSLIDFVIGQKIFAEEDNKKRKYLLWVSLSLNLGLLFFFKYSNFFVQSFVDAFTIFGTSPNIQHLNIILPVGISFYTFQTLSYTLDIYYKKLEPTKNLMAFFAFVSFFPQLVAGPIERAKDLLPQFFEKRNITYDLLRSGILLMAYGFFKKIVIADRLAIFVNASYADVHKLDGPSAIFAIIFFAFQLYLDFSAYSDIAIGGARMLGFNLSTNFLRPYLASSFSNFWKRWHISLSSWFKDYVYIPLGGNKGSQFFTYRNLIIVFLLSGLWHGASWNFVIWGALNGMFVILFDRFFTNDKPNIALRILTAIFVSGLWTLSLIFFRAQTFADALQMFENLFAASNELLYTFGLNEAEFNFTIKLLFAFVAFEILLEKYTQIYEWFLKLNVLLRWAFYLLLIAFIILFGSYGLGLNDNSFIYFQF